MRALAPVRFERHGALTDRRTAATQLRPRGTRDDLVRLELRQRDLGGTVRARRQPHRTRRPVVVQRPSDVIMALCSYGII